MFSRARSAARAVASKTAAAALGAVVFASLLAPCGQAHTPLAARLSALEVVGPGRLSFGVSIVGLEPSGAEMIEERAMVDGETIEEPPTALVGAVDHFSIVLDLRAGQSRIDGVAAADFPPIPPPGENVPVSLEIVVRQGAQTATARQTGRSCCRP